MLIRRKPPKSESIAVDNKLETYPNSRDAAGLFRRMLKNVRKQTADNRKKREAENSRKEAAG